MLADYLALEREWDIQVASVGLSPLAPTMNRRSICDAFWPPVPRSLSPVSPGIGRRICSYRPRSILNRQTWMSRFGTSRPVCDGRRHNCHKRGRVTTQGSSNRPQSRLEATVCVANRGFRSPRASRLVVSTPTSAAMSARLRRPSPNTDRIVRACALNPNSESRISGPWSPVACHHRRADRRGSP